MLLNTAKMHKMAGQGGLCTWSRRCSWCASCTGSGKNAAITAGNEVTYSVVEKPGSKAIDNTITGPTPDMSGSITQGIKQTVCLIERGLKKETIKTLDKFKDKEKDKN